MSKKFYERTNGETRKDKKYHSFTIWGKTFSFSTGQAFKVVTYILVGFWGLNKFFYPIVKNIDKIPEIETTVNDTNDKVDSIRYRQERILQFKNDMERIHKKELQFKGEE